MGDILIHIPQQIHIEYTLENARLTKRVLDVLNGVIVRDEVSGQQETDTDHLLGLFAEQADLLDQVVESAMQTRETATLRVQ
jgi:hypothetical protein